MFPYIDPAGVQRRSFLRPSYFQDIEQQTLGFTAQAIATHSSSINSRLRKRYGGLLPFGQQAPVLLGAGTSAPSLTLTGRPVLGSVIVRLQVATAGVIGTATLRYSLDGSPPSLGPLTTSALVALPGTGMSIVVPTSPAAVFGADNVFAASPPVPETILRWLTVLVTVDVMRRHGVNPEDPLLASFTGDLQLVNAQIEEAANSQTGLFDLPVSEDEGSAIDTGGPRGYSEQSPYAWTYKQQAAAYRGASGWCGRCGSSPCVCRNGLVGG